MVQGDPAPGREPLPRIVVEADPAFCCQSLNPFLNHKTTNRAVYDSARVRHGIGQARGAFDVLLVNEYGCVTECTIANIMVEVQRADGSHHWITPTVTDGAHPSSFFLSIFSFLSFFRFFLFFSLSLCLCFLGLLRGILRAELLAKGFLTERSISLVEFRALVQVYIFLSSLLS